MDFFSITVDHIYVIQTNVEQLKKNVSHTAQYGAQEGT